MLSSQRASSHDRSAQLRRLATQGCSEAAQSHRTRFGLALAQGEQGARRDAGSRSQLRQTAAGAIDQHLQVLDLYEHGRIVALLPNFS